MNNTAAAAIVRSEVKYICVGAWMGSGASGKFRHLSASIYVQPYGREKTMASTAKEAPRSIDNKPTMGYAPLGYTLFDRTAGASTTVTFQYETALAADAAASATSVTIAAATGVANGDIVGILLDDQTTHWSAVSALAGTTFTVSALPSPAATGARVVFNRWA